ncbi:MAG: hypothetical protein ACK47B_10755 [Armatimonadota bacterium]
MLQYKRPGWRAWVEIPIEPQTETAAWLAFDAAKDNEDVSEARLLCDGQVLDHHQKEAADVAA